jgi:hypothetical protein
MDGAVTNLLDVSVGELLRSLHSMAGIFSGTGMTFLVLAFTLSVVGGVYNWWTSGSIQDLVSNGVRMIILMAPLLVLLNGWGSYMGSFVKFFHTGLPAVVGVPGDTPEAIVGKTIQGLQKAVQFNNTADTKKEWYDRISDFFSLANVFSALIWILVFVLNALLAFAMIFAVFMPVAAMSIGVIFGPLILAWLPWRPLADMSSRWLGFMIANGITFVVAIVIMKALGVSIENMTMQLVKVTSSSKLIGTIGYLFTMMALVAIYIFATNLLLQANNIAQGMTGGATVGEGLFGKLAAAFGAAGMMRAGGATANLHKMGAQAGARAAAKAPGAAGKLADYTGKGAQALGVVGAISNVPGSSAMSAAGNVLRASAAPLNATQKAIDSVGSAAGNVLNKVKNTGVYKELDKPIRGGK